MMSKRSRVLAGLAVSAAIALSGAVAKANAEHCKVPGSGQAVSKVGKVVPINMLSGAKDYSFKKATGDCCGPYHQKCCPRFVG